MSAPLKSVVPRQIRCKQRSRPDQTHVSPQDIPELRNLVNAEPAQNSTERRATLAVRYRIAKGVAQFFCHRPKFVHDKHRSSVPAALLSEQNGSPHPASNQTCNGECHGSGHNQKNCRTADVNQTLYCSCELIPAAAAAATESPCLRKIHSVLPLFR